MKKIAVLGSGLLGGSMALGVQACMSKAVSVSLWGRRKESVEEAREVGVSHATTDLAEVVEGADLIVLSTPVGAMLSVLDQVQRVVDLAGVLITDVGSVKLTPRETLRDVVQGCGAIYIGSHPMAGSEQAGVRAACGDLFQGAACVITNDFNHPEEEVEKLRVFWRSLGCVCHESSSEEHDRVMARISHFPHLLASVGAMVGLKGGDGADLAGNGMRDTTRVASGHPGMWAEILLRNKGAMMEPIREAQGYLSDVLAFLEQSDEKALVQFLEEAKQLRDQMDS